MNSNHHYQHLGPDNLNALLELMKSLSKKLSGSFLRLISKKVIVATSFVIIISPYAFVNAKTKTMNLGWATPLDSDYGVFAKKFKELVEGYTDGGIVVKLRPSGQIGGEDEAFKALQLGTVDAYFISQPNISPHFPLMDVLQLPYIFRDQKHLATAMEGPVGEILKSKLHEQTGVYLLAYGAPLYRDLYNTKHDINNLEDLSGLKLRVPKNEVMIDTFRKFGAEPVPLAWSETPTALQTGTIDGADNGTGVIYDMKFYEFASHLTILEHFISVVPLLASERFVSKLTDDEWSIIKKSAAEAEKYQKVVLAEDTEKVRKNLADKGMKVTRPNKEPFIAVSVKIQDDFAKKKGNEFQEILKKIRSN